MKLYYILRDDLRAGRKLAQIVHVADAFREAHPEIHREWMTKSNTVVVYKANASEIDQLIQEAESHGYRFSEFVEPDYADYGGPVLTSLAIEPKASHLVEGRFKLAS